MARFVRNKRFKPNIFLPNESQLPNFLCVNCFALNIKQILKLAIVGGIDFEIFLLLVDFDFLY